MSDAPDDRLYAVITKSHRPHDSSLLALRKGGTSHNGGFWTQDRPDDVALLAFDAATDKAAELHWNSPQIYRAEKALKIIIDQRDARLAKATGQTCTPIEIPDLPDPYDM